MSAKEKAQLAAEPKIILFERKMCAMTTVYHDSNQTNLLEQEVNPIVQKYYPKLLKPLHACLSVLATLSLKDRTKPLSLIFEASSGVGKTAVLQMTFPIKKDLKTPCELEKYVYRSDKFTPKSFVSHAANVKDADLKYRPVAKNNK